MTQLEIKERFKSLEDALIVLSNKESSRKRELEQLTLESLAPFNEEKQRLTTELDLLQKECKHPNAKVFVIIGDYVGDCPDCGKKWC